MRSLLILALVLAACGGGPKASAPASEDAEEYTGSSGSEASAAPAQQKDDSGITELTKKRRQATYKVVYKWSSSGASGSKTQADETWYSKPPKQRIDWGTITDVSGMSQYVLDNGSYVCERSKDGATCWKAGGDAKSVEELSFTAAIMTAYEGLLTDPSFPVTRETRTIAGQRGSCAKATNLVMLGFAEITICYASNGVPLLFQWKAGADTFSLEAASYTTTVTDKDFELPGKLLEYP